MVLVAKHVCVYSLHHSIGPQPYPVIYYAVANPGRGLLDRKISEKHLQCSNGSIKTTYVCMYACMYVFIKLHITTQSGPVILVILCHSH